MECDVCGTKENLLRARKDGVENVHICEKCYDRLCEGYELLP